MIAPKLPVSSPRLSNPQTPKLAARKAGAWRVSVVLAGTFGAVCAALHSVLQDADWWFYVTGMVLLILGSAAISRALSWRRWLPTVVSALTLLIAGTVFFAPKTALLFVIPTPATLGSLSTLAAEGAASIAAQSVPAEANLAVVLVLCLGIGAMAVVADLLAGTLRRPALASIPLATILLVPTALGAGLADLFFIVMATIGWLVLLRAGDQVPQTSRALGIGALTLAVALVVPLVLPPVSAPQLAQRGFAGYLSSVNPVLDLGEELRRDVPRTILTYRTDSGEPTYLRLVTMQDFQAETWEPDPPAIDRSNLPSGIPVPAGLSPDVLATSQVTSVSVGNLGSPWLPVPYPVQVISGLRGDWFFSSTDLTFSSPIAQAKGEEFLATSLNVQPTPAQLEAAGSAASEGSPTNEGGAGVGPTGGTDERYLELPAGLPTIIGDTARQVTSTAASDYARAVALQEYFRNGAFTYSETAPVDYGYDSNGMTAIAQFLEAKSGYCVHFASAMAVMARTLGMPSRVTVGFLPGTKQAVDQEAEPEGEQADYLVSTQDVHAWPELYFEGIGWMRFEPTPGRGIVPSYASEATPGVPIAVDPSPVPSSEPASTPTPTRSSAPLDHSATPDSSVLQVGGLNWFVAALVAFGLLALLLIPAVIRIAQRAIRLRRLTRGHPAATTLWRELLQSATDLGISTSDTNTPRESAVALSLVAKLSGLDQRALDSILDLIERQSFAGETPGSLGQTGGVESLGAIIWAQRLSQVLGGLRSQLGWWVRLRAVIAPRSIWVLPAPPQQ